MIGAYTADTKLGPIVVAETNEGICAILFGESELASLAELMKLFPEDEISHKAIHPSSAIASYIEDGTAYPDLRLDIRTGTEFQQQVWLEIMKIPRGETITYAELAKRVGKPTAWRAVASACGKNIIGGLIPCHRVVGKDTTKMQYRWGAEKKRKLLEMEKNK